MKRMKKFVSLLVAMVMVLAMTTSVFAQEQDVKTGNGSITISNAAKGETYTIYKLFDATVSATETNGVSDSIAYTGTIPESLKDYFTADTQGNITAKLTEMNDDMKDALKKWASSATETASATSDGSELTFKNVAYGYYVITSTQDNGTAISVDSTRPNAKVVDKNSTTPKELTKKVENTEYNIGDTINYTVSFKTSNYDGAGTAAKEIKSYTIHDTLPEFLTNVTVTKITIGETEYKVNGTAPQFSDNKTITIPWYNEEAEQFIYDNGAKVVITYSATLTDKAAIDGNGNTNTVTLTWATTDKPDNGKLTDEETVYTYAIAVQKIDPKANPLAGAEFELPFYVKETKDTDGAYIYAGTTAGAGLTNKITTDATGLFIVKGVKQGEYTITETKAPDGYNRLLNSVKATAVQTGKTTTQHMYYLDADGNVTDTETSTKIEVKNDNIAVGKSAVVVVVNKTGTELPSTGGMGTTVLYIAGVVLVLAAVVLLFARRRAGKEA